MFTSNRIPHDSGLYHEHIFYNDKIVAQLLSEEDGSFWYVLTHNNSLSRGYHSMAAAKKQLCLCLNRIYN